MPKYLVKIHETIEWTDEIEHDNANHFEIEKIVANKWINSEYSDQDSCSSLGSISVVQITKVKNV